MKDFLVCWLGHAAWIVATLLSAALLVFVLVLSPIYFGAWGVIVDIGAAVLLVSFAMAMDAR